MIYHGVAVPRLTNVAPMALGIDLAKPPLAEYS
jgi:hypothetical protein